MKLVEKDFFKRNRKIIIISVMIFVVFALAGAAFTYVSVGDQYGAITRTINNMTANNTGMVDSPVDLVIPDETVYVFFHNLAADLIVVAGGLLFSVISVFILAFNAFSIGSPFGVDLLYASAGILPHGIIEYAASIISLAAAFNITKLEIAMIKNRSFKDTLTEHKTELKDILILIVAVVILLAVAAVIECNVTGYIIGWTYGI